MEHATPSGPATSSLKNVPRLLAADASDQLADEPAERDAVVAVPRPRFPGRLAAGDGGGDRLGVLPSPRPSHDSRRSASGHADGALTGD